MTKEEKEDREPPLHKSVKIKDHLYLVYDKCCMGSWKFMTSIKTTAIATCKQYQHELKKLAQKLKNKARINTVWCNANNTW